MGYIYLPSIEAEFSVWDETEAEEYFSPMELSDAKPAQMVVAMDLANHGQVGLPADFLDEAAELVKSHFETKPVDVRDRQHTFGNCKPAEEIQTAGRWAHDAHLYRAHNGAVDCVASNPEGVPCNACWNLFDLVMEAEGLLSDIGYVTEWDDGVRVWKVVALNADA